MLSSVKNQKFWNETIKIGAYLWISNREPKKYALTVWVCANITTLRSIDRVQEKAMKLSIIGKFNSIDSLIEKTDASLLQQVEKINFNI